MGLAFSFPPSPHLVLLFCRSSGVPPGAGEDFNDNPLDNITAGLFTFPSMGGGRGGLFDNRLATKANCKILIERAGRLDIRAAQVALPRLSKLRSLLQTTDATNASTMTTCVRYTELARLYITPSSCSSSSYFEFLSPYTCRRRVLLGCPLLPLQAHLTTSPPPCPPPPASPLSPPPHSPPPPPSLSALSLPPPPSSPPPLYPPVPLSSLTTLPPLPPSIVVG